VTYFTLGVRAPAKYHHAAQANKIIPADLLCIVMERRCRLNLVAGALSRLLIKKTTTVRIKLFSQPERLGPHTPIFRRLFVVACTHQKTRCVVSELLKIEDILERAIKAICPEVFQSQYQ
jgi:hypothetical protein